VIGYATGKLMRAQAIGVGIGAVGGLIAGILFVRRKQASPVPVPTRSSAKPGSDRANIPPVGP
jgi:F0F1-type ATP synthase assembly protein I